MGNNRPNPLGSLPDLGAYEISYMPPVVLNVPGDYSSIQAGLTAAGTNDTVLVQPGTYTENIIWPETNGIKLISAGDSSNTIIDGGGVSIAIILTGNLANNYLSDTKITGFTIKNGQSNNNGGGVRIINANIELSSLIIESNNAGTNGGGIYIYSSNCSLNNIRIQNNNSFNNGGGIAIGDTSIVIFNDCNLAII